MVANPYNWQSHKPKVQVPRPDVDLAAETLLGNGSAVVMGGRGMGKSVFLGQLKAKLERAPGTRVLTIIAPPATLTVEACLAHLAKILGVPEHRGAYSVEIFESYFARADAPERLVLLFDEFDRYAEKGGPSAQPPGRGFFNDLEAARRELPGLGLLAAGSIGIFVFRDVLGSSFLSRALHLRLRPFGRSEAVLLTGPFEDRGTFVPEEVRDALFLASGGIPALLTYGLQELWKLDREADPGDVTAVYRRFEAHYGDYLRDLLSALTDPRFSNAPLRVWEYVQANSGRIRRVDLEQALGEPSGVLRLTVTDALHLLETVGVARLEGSALHDNPVVVYPISSLLNLPTSSLVEDDVRGDFLRDLQALLARLHRSSADFYRPGARSDDKRLVPESVFAAHLALGFELLGWRTEREAQRGAGRTDLLLRRNGDAEVVVLEVKIWGRNDYREAHAQVESYWTDDVTAGAVVQLTDQELTDWPERYLSECLEPLGLKTEVASVAGTPLAGRFTVSSSTAGGLHAEIDHFLLRLARR
jgi:AAA domain